MKMFGTFGVLFSERKMYNSYLLFDPAGVVQEPK